MKNILYQIIIIPHTLFCPLFYCKHHHLPSIDLSNTTHKEGRKKRENQNNNKKSEKHAKEK